MSSIELRSSGITKGTVNCTQRSKYSGRVT
eukprot:COSAG02_NODE_1127_length_14428_cov_68.304627_19_plen_29_part_01